MNMKRLVWICTLMLFVTSATSVNHVRHAEEKTIVLLDEPFSENLGDFTLSEQKYPGCTYSTMWYVDKNYGYAKVTANKGGSSLGASDCKLISPALDAKGASIISLRFEHTTYAASTTSDVNYCMVKVSTDGQNWKQIFIPTWPSKRWGFVACDMDLSAYASDKMQIMFEYVSTNSYAGTWEIKNVVVEATWIDDADQTCKYEHLEGLTSADLRQSLHKEIVDHVVLDYYATRGDKAKVDVRDNGTIWDIYSNYVFYPSDYCESGSFAAGECYNREHMLPKSWWGGSNEEPMYTDLHHIIPTDYYANNQRSAWVYDEVKTASWTNNLGTKFGTGKTWSENAFEPVDEYKGDVARVYFYMLTCYMDKNFTTGGKGYRYFKYGNGVCDFQTKALNLMLKWHRQDPVSEREVTRNTKVKALQGNVNPYVIAPNLVEYIWGSMKGKAYDCDEEIVVPEPGTEGAISCTQARELALALSSGSQSSENYIVMGYVTSLEGTYSTQYGSQTFWMADTKEGGNVFYAYQCYHDSPVETGDKITLSGKLLNYYGKPEIKWGQTTILVPATVTALENIPLEGLDWMDEQVKIYTITGVNVSALRQNLSPGIYILQQGEEVCKTLIR